MALRGAYSSKLPTCTHKSIAILAKPRLVQQIEPYKLPVSAPIVDFRVAPPIKHNLGKQQQSDQNNYRAHAPAQDQKETRTKPKKKEKHEIHTVETHTGQSTNEKSPKRTSIARRHREADRAQDDPRTKPKRREKAERSGT